MRPPNTLGDLFMAVASGREPGRKLSEQEANLIHQEFSEAIGPTIEAIRAEQRKAAEDTMSFVVF